MDLWDLTKVLFRRWYVFAPVLVASLVVVLLVAQNVKPDYSAVGHLQMIPPPERPSSQGVNAPKANNRWLDLGFPALGSAVILQAQSEEILSELTKAGFTDNFTVAMEYGTTYLTIEAIGTSRAQATATVQQLMKVLDQLVTRLQEQFAAPKQDQITTLKLDNGDKVEAVTSKKKRVAIVAIGLALMLSVGASIGIDALLRLRRRPAGKGDKPVIVPAGPVGSAPAPVQPADSTVVLRLPGAINRPTGARAASGREETVRIYPGGLQQSGPADDSARRSEITARAEIAARAEAAARGEGREPPIVPVNAGHANGHGAPVNGQSGDPAGGKPGTDNKGAANGRSGVTSWPPRPVMENGDHTIILPVPRTPRTTRDDKS